MSSSSDTKQQSRLSLATVSLFVAALSLGSSFYQGYLNTRNIEIVQRNVARAEYIRTCKETIEAYFQIKLKTAMLIDHSRERTVLQRNTGDTMVALDAANTVSRFKALGTYLANFHGEPIRAQYTQLSNELESIIGRAGSDGKPVEVLFESADKLFTAMNENCSNLSRIGPT